jgi:hypothetical protein
MLCGFGITNAEEMKNGPITNAEEMKNGPCVCVCG